MGAISADFARDLFPSRTHTAWQLAWSGPRKWQRRMEYWDEKRAGLITIQDWEEIENGIARSCGGMHDDGDGRNDDERG
jgi:hypothetical protein